MAGVLPESSIESVPQFLLEFCFFVLLIEIFLPLNRFPLDADEELVLFVVASLGGEHVIDESSDFFAFLICRLNLLATHLKGIPVLAERSDS